MNSGTSKRSARRGRTGPLDLTLDDLFRAHPENVVRLGIALGINSIASAGDHYARCRAVVHWLKRHPQPRRDRR